MIVQFTTDQVRFMRYCLDHAPLRDAAIGAREHEAISCMLRDAYTEHAQLAFDLTPERAWSLAHIVAGGHGDFTPREYGEVVLLLKGVFLAPLTTAQSLYEVLYVERALYAEEQQHIHSSLRAALDHYAWLVKSDTCQTVSVRQLGANTDISNYNQQERYDAR